MNPKFCRHPQDELACEQHDTDTHSEAVIYCKLCDATVAVIVAYEGERLS